MQEDTLVQISHKLKEKRRERNITMQELADKANVSKGLISQIENSRTIPSLVVLIDIIKALDINLDIFFKDIKTQDEEPLAIIKRKNEYDAFEKEDAIGFQYHRIFTQSISPGTVDIVLLDLEPGANRPMAQTEAYEYKYVISGEVEYRINDTTYTLYPGDSILFDGRLPHTPRNISDEKVQMLIAYFFEDTKSQN